MKNIAKKMPLIVLVLLFFIFLITGDINAISSPSNSEPVYTYQINNTSTVTPPKNIEPGYTFVNGVIVREWPAGYIPMTQIEIEETQALITKFQSAAIKNPDIQTETFFTNAEQDLIARYQEYCELRYISKPADYGLNEPPTIK